jgi:hypothetical protein
MNLSLRMSFYGVESTGTDDASAMPITSSKTKNAPMIKLGVNIYI